MTDLELVNAFLARNDLSETEAVLKNKCLTLDQSLNAARQEFQTLNEQHQAKQREVVALSSQLDGVLQVVLEVAKNGEANAAVLDEPKTEFVAPSAE